jgi:hypothetical protein
MQQQPYVFKFKEEHQEDLEILDAAIASASALRRCDEETAKEKEALRALQVEHKIRREETLKTLQELTERVYCSNLMPSSGERMRTMKLLRGLQTRFQVERPQHGKLYKVYREQQEKTNEAAGQTNAAYDHFLEVRAKRDQKRKNRAEDEVIHTIEPVPYPEDAEDDADSLRTPSQCRKRLRFEAAALDDDEEDCLNYV